MATITEYDYQMESLTQWLDAHEQAAWRGFLAMQSKLLSHLGRELQRHSGLSDADFAVLVELSEAPQQRLRLRELGARLDWAKSRLSRQISRMAERGLVEREECLTDGRGAFAILTETGRTTIEAAAPRHLQEVRKWFIDALTPQQLDAMASISAAIVERLPEIGPTAA
jgi:DNA-binding MarR family transcriptional regulator